MGELQQAPEIDPTAGLDAAATDRRLPSIIEDEAAEIATMLRKIKPGRQAADIARMLLKGDRPVVWGAGEQVAALGDARKYTWRERHISAWSIGVADLRPPVPEQAEAALMEVVAGHVPVNDLRTVYPIAWSFVASIPVGFFIALLFPERSISFLGFWTLMVFAWTIMFSVVLGPIYCIRDDGRMHDVRGAATLALGRLRLPRSVSLLAESLFDKRIVVRRAAIPALKASLPALRPEYFGWLDGYLVPRLCRGLKIKDEELTCAIMGALHKVGDGRAIGPLEKYRVRASPLVAEHIDSLLPILRERAQMMKDARTLLRPSEHLEGSLLRPSGMGNSIVDSERLLRATEFASDDAEQ